MESTKFNLRINVNIKNKIKFKTKNTASSVTKINFIKCDVLSFLIKLKEFKRELKNANKAVKTSINIDVARLNCVIATQNCTKKLLFKIASN